jgi:hypothetical protein
MARKKKLDTLVEEYYEEEQKEELLGFKDHPGLTYANPIPLYSRTRSKPL